MTGQRLDSDNQANFLTNMVKKCYENSQIRNEVETRVDKPGKSIVGRFGGRSSFCGGHRWVMVATDEL